MLVKKKKIVQPIIHVISNRSSCDMMDDHDERTKKKSYTNHQ